VGNLIFAATPISGNIANSVENMTDAVSNAGAYVAAPSLVLGAMDFYPLPGRCQGTALPLSQFAADVDYDKDFNGTSKSGGIFRGAYAGEGANPGWRLAADIKDLGSVIHQDGGTTSDGAEGVDASQCGDDGSSPGGEDGGQDSGAGGEADGGVGADTDLSVSDSRDGVNDVSGGCGCHPLSNSGSAAVVLAIILIALAAGRLRPSRRL
jgi:hypothetical protein